MLHQMNMHWFDAKIHKPSHAGVYTVMRQWNESVVAIGECYYDGMFWQPKIMEECAGPVTKRGFIGKENGK